MEIYNYYKLFEINTTSKSKEILDAYKNKINKFKNIDNITSVHISEIKLLKKGLYILLDKKIRLKYNNELNKNTEPVAMNYENDDSFDSVFNIDNSWMDKHIIKKNDKKNDSEFNLIGERIFSLSNLNKKPGYTTNDEIDLRKTLQGRIDKQN